jgi:hypothetical protein
MSDGHPSAADPSGAIADEFVEAFRQGKHSAVEEFARRYPEQANAIRWCVVRTVGVTWAGSAARAARGGIRRGSDRRPMLAPSVFTDWKAARRRLT